MEETITKVPQVPDYITKTEEAKKAAAAVVETGVSKIVQEEGLTVLQAVERMYLPFQVEGKQVTREEFFMASILAKYIELEKLKENVSLREGELERLGISKNSINGVHDIISVALDKDAKYAVGNVQEGRGEAANDAFYSDNKKAA